MKGGILGVLFIGLCLFGASFCAANDDRKLTFQDAALAAVQDAPSLPPLFRAAMAKAKRRADTAIRDGIDVPIPLDPGGGYSHEKHKANGILIHDAGKLFLLTGRVEYRQLLVRLLEAYSALYPQLGLHPARKNQAPGRLFWQSLNEAVWLVYAIQGYDAVRASLTDAQRSQIETALFLPMATFLSTGSPKTFRKIHNHGTWAAAAVGMTGYVLDRDDLVDRAILGLDGDGSSGFLAQLEQLFSPDGYYTEGPYYQRYALMPFVYFARAIDRNDPQRKIFAFRDSIVGKAIDTTIQLSYNGKFFPINDAIKDKGIDTIELVLGVASLYQRTRDARLLSIAKAQGRTVFSEEGFFLARDLASGLATDYALDSRIFRDGRSGDQGALGVLRLGSGPLSQTVVAKNTSQGMGHGHFDKLSFLLYDAGSEVITDYGAARFLNVPAKNGGRYLAENTSWAKQSVAHNTLVVDETSHFQGNWKQAQKAWPRQNFALFTPQYNAISATEAKAYPGVSFTRTLVQLHLEKGRPPVVIDLLKAVSKTDHHYDVPLYYSGQLIDHNLAFDRPEKSLSPVGSKNGYQHLWREAEAPIPQTGGKVTWLSRKRFYSAHFMAPQGSRLMLTRTGATDPNANLRSEPGMMVRAPRGSTATFITVIEPHGLYDPADEVTVQSVGDLKSVSATRQGDVDIITLKGQSSQVVLAIKVDASDQTQARISLGQTDYQITGNIGIFRP